MTQTGPFTLFMILMATGKTMSGGKKERRKTIALGIDKVIRELIWERDSHGKI